MFAQKGPRNGAIVSGIWDVLLPGAGVTVGNDGNNNVVSPQILASLQIRLAIYLLSPNPPAYQTTSCATRDVRDD